MSIWYLNVALRHREGTWLRSYEGQFGNDRMVEDVCKYYWGLWGISLDILIFCLNNNFLWILL